MVCFISMIYLSYCLRALRDTHLFRTLFLAAVLFQGMGAIAYVIMPALGPFVFEAGVEPMQTAAQQGMLEAYRANVAEGAADRKSTRLNSSHVKISYAVFCLKKKNTKHGA